MIKKRLRIHAKSLSEALAPSKKHCLRRWLLAALRDFRIYSRSAYCLADFGHKGSSVSTQPDLAHISGATESVF